MPASSYSAPILQIAVEMLLWVLFLAYVFGVFLDVSKESNGYFIDIVD